MNLRNIQKLPSCFNLSLLSYSKLPTYIDIYNTYKCIKIKNPRNSKKSNNTPIT